MESQLIVLLGGLLLLVACGGPAREVPAPIVTEVHFSETSAPPQATATPRPLALNVAELAYLDDARDLWLMEVGDNPARRKITTQGNIRSFVWSPDGQILAYLVNGAVWLYDMQNGQPACLCHGLPDADLGLRLSWSPQQQYLVLNRGTSMSQKLSMLEAATGQIVKEINVISGYAWGPDESQLLIGQRHHLDEPIAVQPGDTVDLAVVSLDDPAAAPEILLEGSAEVLYFPRDWLADGQIHYSRLDWNEARQTGEQSYWAAPWQDGELGVPEPLPDPYPRDSDTQLRQRLTERLPLQDDDLYWDWSPDHTQLVVAVGPPGKLYLLEGESSAAPRFLGAGLEPSWRPARAY